MCGLDELVENNCKNSVKFYKLSEIVEFLNGKGHERNIDDKGKYIVVNSKFVSTNGEVKKYSNKQICPIFKDDVLMVMSDLPNGKALAKCFFAEENEKYTLNQRVCALKVKDKNLISSRFLYFYLNRNRQLLKFDNGIDQTNLRKDQILNIIIPVPSLEVQDEIVSILDNFTLISEKILEELMAELKYRQRQYEYYRDKLLSKECKNKVDLGSLCEIITKGTTPSNFSKEGVFFIKTEAFENGFINKNKLSYIDEDVHCGKLKRSILKENDILFTIAGATIGKMAIVTKDLLPANTNQALAIIRLNRKINIKYLKFILSSNCMKKYIQKCVKSSAQPNLNLHQLSKFEMPFPKEEEQQNIVNILERFDNLCHNISERISAEIRARQMQLEFYRDKLLTFNTIK